MRLTRRPFVLAPLFALALACDDGAAVDPAIDADAAPIDDATRDAPDGAPDIDTDVDTDDADAGDDAVDAAIDPPPDAAPDAGAPRPELPTDRARAAFCGDAAEVVEARIDDTIPSLTLAQKVSLMHGVRVIPTDNTWQTAGIAEAGIAGFHMLDGPRGLSRFSGLTGTAFPVAMARGASWDVELEADVGRMIAAELRTIGADTVLAPTVNILRHPRWGRAQETYGEDPLHVGLMGAAFVEGAQTHVMAVVKHYAANSIEDTRLEVNVNLDARTLRELYLPHFRRIVQDARVAGVMTAYNQVNGDWASESTHLLRDILQRDWDFAGYTMSDFTWGTHDTVRAIEGGLDVEMQYPQVYGPPLVAAVEDGLVDEQLVDHAVRRILRAQWCWAENATDSSVTETESDEALALAERAAVASMVLLENRADALPIDRTSAPTIAVVGSLADEDNTGDRGSSHVNATDVVSPLEGLRALAEDATIVHVPGDLSDEASRDVVSSADVVIAVVGYSETEEGEGQVAAGDRASLSLPDDDVVTLTVASQIHDRVVAVVVGGSAFVTDAWGDEVEAIVASWYAGSRGGNALATLLYGDANFAGRLPITFAAADDDLPPFDNTSLDVSYGYFHGYRHLQNEGTAALYPLGHGLSYTTFAWGAPEVEVGSDALDVSVSVENTGDVEGVETVFVFVSAPDDGGDTAPRDLRAFARVQLDPGDTETAEARVPLDDLARWDEARGAWRMVPGPYRVEIGPDADNVSLAGAFTIQEDAP